jgi:hypothetical protein
VALTDVDITFDSFPISISRTANPECPVRGLNALDTVCSFRTTTEGAGWLAESTILRTVHRRAPVWIAGAATIAVYRRMRFAGDTDLGMGALFTGWITLPYKPATVHSAPVVVTDAVSVTTSMRVLDTFVAVAG